MMPVLDLRDKTLFHMLPGAADHPDAPTHGESLADGFDRIFREEKEKLPSVIEAPPVVGRFRSREEFEKAKHERYLHTVTPLLQSLFALLKEYVESSLKQGRPICRFPQSMLMLSRWWSDGSAVRLDYLSMAGSSSFFPGGSAEIARQDTKRTPLLCIKDILIELLIYAGLFFLVCKGFEWASAGRLPLMDLGGLMPEVMNGLYHIIFFVLGVAVFVKLIHSVFADSINDDLKHIFRYKNIQERFRQHMQSESTLDGYRLLRFYILWHAHEGRELPEELKDHMLKFEDDLAYYTELFPEEQVLR